MNGIKAMISRVAALSFTREGVGSTSGRQVTACQNSVTSATFVWDLTCVKSVFALLSDHWSTSVLIRVVYKLIQQDFPIHV